MLELRFYLDENIPLEVATQLSLSMIDVVSAHGLGALGAEDLDHLQSAVEMGRVLCTHDQDFLRLSAQGEPHAGIAFGHQKQVSIGGWVRALRSLHAQLDAEQMQGQVVFLAF